MLNNIIAKLILKLLILFAKIVKVFLRNTYKFLEKSNIKYIVIIFIIVI
jgi:hypothetical protein